MQSAILCWNCHRIRPGVGFLVESYRPRPSSQYDLFEPLPGALYTRKQGHILESSLTRTSMKSVKVQLTSYNLEIIFNKNVWKIENPHRQNSG